MQYKKQCCTSMKVCTRKVQCLLGVVVCGGSAHGLQAGTELSAGEEGGGGEPSSRGRTELWEATRREFEETRRTANTQTI